MKCIEIAEDQWPRFCAEFSREHHGQSVTTFVERDGDLPGGAAWRCTARDLPFYGLTLERHQRDLMVELGEGKLRVTECIHDATCLCSLRAEEGAELGLRIIRPGHHAFFLTFRGAGAADCRNGTASTDRPQG